MVKNKQKFWKQNQLIVISLKAKFLGLCLYLWDRFIVEIGLSVR